VLIQKMLPELRTDLFGRNENRKFYTVSSRPLVAILSHEVLLFRSRIWRRQGSRPDSIVWNQRDTYADKQ
jgi:hypothetical protein